MKLSPYLAACKAQGVEVARPIQDAFETHASYELHTYEPTDETAAIAAVGGMLRQDSKEPMISGALAVDGRLVHSSDARALTTILNTSVGKYEMQPDQVVLDQQYGAVAVHACRQAEQRFAQVATQGLQHADRARDQFASRIVVDANADPIFWTKNYGEKLSLALRPFVLHGIAFPEGSLVAVAVENDDMQSYGSNFSYLYELDMSGHGNQVVGIDDISDISVLRLSGYAFDPGHRRRLFDGTLEVMRVEDEYGQEQPIANKKAMDFAATATLDDIRHFASTATGTLHTPKKGKLF